MQFQTNEIVTFSVAKKTNFDHILLNFDRKIEWVFLWLMHIQAIFIHLAKRGYKIEEITAHKHDKSKTPVKSFE